MRFSRLHNNPHIFTAHASVKISNNVLKPFQRFLVIKNLVKILLTRKYRETGRHEKLMFNTLSPFGFYVLTRGWFRFESNLSWSCPSLSRVRRKKTPLRRREKGKRGTILPFSPSLLRRDNFDFTYAEET